MKKAVAAVLLALVLVGFTANQTKPAEAWGACPPGYLLTIQKAQISGLIWVGEHSPRSIQAKLLPLYREWLARLQQCNPPPPPVNQAPVANAGVDQEVEQGVLVTLSGSGSDPEGSSLAYAWQQVSGQSVSLGGANTASPSFISPSGSTTTESLVFRLVVNDGQLNSAADTVSVVVNPPPSPPCTPSGSQTYTLSEGSVDPTLPLPSAFTVDKFAFCPGDTVTLKVTATSAPTAINSVVFVIRTNTQGYEASGSLFSGTASSGVWQATWVVPDGVAINNQYGYDVILRNTSTATAPGAKGAGGVGTYTWELHGLENSLP